MKDGYGRASRWGVGEHGYRERGIGSGLMTYHGICCESAMLGYVYRTYQVKLPPPPWAFLVSIEQGG